MNRGMAAVAAIASALALAGCPGVRRPAEGCSKDTDCKGERICRLSQCVEPGPRVSSPGLDAPPPAPPPGSPPFAMFKGDARNTGRVAAAAPEVAPVERWRFRTGGPVVGSPSVGPDGTIYVASHDGKLYALSPDGAQRWSFATGDRVWSTPAVAQDGTVYVGSDDDHLYAVDGATGAERWRLRIGACAEPTGFGPEGARCDADGGPTLGPDGTIYLGGDGVHAVWPNGTLRWKLATSEHVSAAPAVTDDGAVFATSQDDTLYALEPGGSKRWELRTGDDLDGAPAVGDDGTVYVGGDDRMVYAVAADGALRWKVVTGGQVRASPSIGRDGTIYVGSYDRYLYAIAPDGQVRWRFAAADKIHGSATIAGNGVILFGSQDDHLYALSSAGALLWYVALDGDVDTAPVVLADGTILVGCDDGSVRAYGQRTP
jgi:outer membrane protein assembly factor BamB